MRAFAALLLVALLLAGCASTPPAPAGTVALERQYDDGGANRLDVPVLPATPPAPGERTLEAAPKWRLGEWWTYRVTDGFTGQVADTTRVVAGTDGGNYLVGFPIERFDDNILIFHVPGYGDVRQSDLSFEVHDAVFTPYKFPLRAGDQWETAFEGLGENVTVESAEGTKAALTAAPTGDNGYVMELDYDAENGDFTRLHIPGYATLEVTGHGYGYTGTVRVPHAHDLVFMHGRLAGVHGITQPLTDPTPQTLTETVEVPPGYDRLAFTEIVGSFVGQLAGPSLPSEPTALGYYSERVQAPNGTAYETTVKPGEAPLKLAFFGTGDPTGTWTLTHTAGGPGIAMAEGIGYHSIDVQLPSGCVVASYNAQHHKAPCNVAAAEAGVAQAP